MSDEQIRMLYRDAADKDKQVIILCQLTTKPQKEICEILGIPFKNRKSKYGWTEEQMKFLHENMGVMTDREIAKAVHKTTHAVQQMRYKIESKPKRSNSRWRDNETAFLRNAYKNNVSPKRIGKLLGKSTKAIYSKIHELRIKGELYE